jgi:hypothetical protein
MGKQFIVGSFGDPGFGKKISALSLLHVNPGGQ